MNQRLMITGASGTLGKPLSALATQSWDTFSTYFSNPDIGGGKPYKLDLTDGNAAEQLVREIQPNVIIHAATSDRSANISTTIPTAAQHIAAAAKNVNAYLIALSTDVIFDGTKAPYDENTHPTPVHSYGKAKALSEEIIAQQTDNYLIVRTSLLYDFNDENRQVSWMTEEIASGRKLCLFKDEIRQPIWVRNLAEGLLELAAMNENGILHLAGPQALSRYEYGCRLLTILGYEPQQIVESAYAREIAPSRPRDCTLNSEKAQRILKTPLLTIEEAADKSTT